MRGNRTARSHVCKHRKGRKQGHSPCLQAWTAAPAAAVVAAVAEEEDEEEKGLMGARRDKRFVAEPGA